MDNNYIPVELKDVFPGFDAESFVGFLGKRESENPRVETSDFLIDALTIPSDKIENKDALLRNFIYCMTITRKHLLEIDEQLKIIKQRKKETTDIESYSFRKLNFFEKKNNDAKQQIIDFICYGMKEYILNRDNHYSDLIDRNNEETFWLLGPTYDYQYNSKYYNPDYDFSTFAKFYDIPNTPLAKFLQHIEENITQKRDSIDDYNTTVKNTVNNNQLLDKLIERVAKNYHMHQRKEIFDSLLTLFEEKKYLAFVVSATIQLEGMFFDLVSIKYGNKENQGTLSEKVDKAFGNSDILRHTLYPYFAFDVPDLRNQVAHKGLVRDENVEILSYELILDLNCIVSLIERESINKYKSCILIRDKLNEIDSEKLSNDDYYKEIYNCFLIELYKNYVIDVPYFWDMITEPQTFDDELDYYIPSEKDDNMIYLKDLVYLISDMVKRKEFWQTVLDSCKDISDSEHKLNDFGLFVERLKNIFIPRLTDEAKDICVQVNQKIQAIKNVD